jgi:hypothetical protein
VAPQRAALFLCARAIGAPLDPPRKHEGRLTVIEVRRGAEEAAEVAKKLR